MSRRILAPLLSLLLIVGVGFALYLSFTEQSMLRNSVTLHGLVGSEKISFFADPKVQAALSRHGLVVQVEKAGSRQISGFDLKRYDFVFPAGVPAAEKIRREHGLKRSFSVFFTPMVIASWRPVAELLEQNGIVHQRDGAWYVIDMAALLDLSLKQVRWKDLQGADRYPANKGVLITSTDVRKSNSAAMYLSLASYVLNGNEVVSQEAQLDPLIEPLTGLFLRQGFIESSSAEPFNDYLVMGLGKAPLVMIYEAQFLEQAALQGSPIGPDMVLLYPEPTLFTKHILLPTNDDGARLGELLTHDPELQQLAIEHGLRNDNVAAFWAFVQQHQLAIPRTLVNVIEPPSYELLEGAIVRIEQRYQHNATPIQSATP